jgi:hypothetical protein
MRNMNCGTIRREIEEAGSADLLSATAMGHLETCDACATLSRQQTRLQAIIAGMGTVAAPGDFDFRLRSRLAGEKRRGARTPGNMWFSLRYAAVAATLLLIGSLVAFVALRSGPVNPIAAAPVEAPVNGAPASSVGVQLPIENAPAPMAQNLQPVVRSKGRGVRNEVASNRTGNRVGTLDQSGTRASVLGRDELAGSYPTAAFPINASYKSLKVSVDDARGTSRTISLPSVSFGSQRTLSQNTSPMMASARESW